MKQYFSFRRDSIDPYPWALWSLELTSLDQLVQYAEAGRGLVDLIKVPFQLAAPVGVLVVYGIHPHQIRHHVPVMAGATDLPIRTRFKVVLGFVVQLALVAHDGLSTGSGNQSAGELKFNSNK